MKFLENLNAVRVEFDQHLNDEAGKNVTVEDIFFGLEGLGKGKYSTLQDMYADVGFNNQNTVYQVVSRMLDDMGTPPKSVVKRAGAKKKEGTEFALNLLQLKGLKIQHKKRVKKETQETQETTS